MPLERILPKEVAPLKERLEKALIDYSMAEIIRGASVTDHTLYRLLAARRIQSSNATKLDAYLNSIGIRSKQLTAA